MVQAKSIGQLRSTYNMASQNTQNNEKIHIHLYIIKHQCFFPQNNRKKYAYFPSIII